MIEGGEGMQDSYVIWFLIGVAFLTLLCGIGFGIQWRKELQKEKSESSEVKDLNLTSVAESAKRSMLGSVRGLLLIAALFLVLYSQEGMFFRNTAIILFAVYIIWTGYELWSRRKEERATKAKLKDIYKMQDRNR
jgi:protein-S-isoprenylcysteine O-methyltransferase Ste14